MGLVHRHAAKAALPEMPGALEPRMDVAGIAPVHRRQRPADAVGVGGDEDQVNVVRHEDPGPGLHARRRAMLAKQVAIERVIILIEEGRSPAVTALGYVVRMSREDSAGEAGHAAMGSRVGTVRQISALSP